MIVCSGKSEAEVTIIKDYARGITLLKLTTDGHKASRGLSATAELLVPFVVVSNSKLETCFGLNIVSRQYFCVLVLIMGLKFTMILVAWLLSCSVVCYSQSVIGNICIFSAHANVDSRVIGMFKAVTRGVFWVLKPPGNYSQFF